MIKTIVIDKEKNSAELLSSYLKKMDGVCFLGYFGDFSNIRTDNIDLIIFDISKENSNEIFEKIQKIQKENEKIKFIAISNDMDKALLVETLNKNVSDFLFKPVISNILEASVKKIDFSSNEKEQNTIKKAKTIAVFSLKGGVGKTSCALNLAYELGLKAQKNVCLLDFNTNSSDCNLFLNLNPKNNVDDLLMQIQNLNKQTALSLIERFKESNLYVLSVVKENDFALKMNPRKITTIINALKNIFEYIVIDTYCAYDENNLSVLSCCDLILYLSLLSPASIKTTQNMIEMFSKINYNQSKIKLILNRYSDSSQISTEDFEKEVNKEVFFKLPNNYLTMSDAINQSSVLNITNPQSNIAKAFKNLAQEIDNTDIQKENLVNEYNHGIYNIIHKMGE